MKISKKKRRKRKNKDKEEKREVIGKNLTIINDNVYYYGILLSNPVETSFDSHLPTFELLGAFLVRNGGVVDGVLWGDAEDGGTVWRELPDALGDACSEGGTKGSGLAHGRTHDGETEDVSLELQEEAVCRHATIDTEFG